MKFVALTLALVPATLLAQGTGGTGTYGGTVPATFAITDTSNNSLAGVLGSFGTLTIGSGTLATPTPLQFRLRSNAPYTLTAVSSVSAGITDGAPTTAGNTAGALTTGDIGFGFTAAINQSGASVVNGGASPTRTDTIVTGFDATAGFAAATDGRTNFTKTLHDIFGSGIQILSGDRISASGDNSSDDNFLLVTVGLSTLPQYLSPGAFSGSVTFTIATQ